MSSGGEDVIIRSPRDAPRACSGTQDDDDDDDESDEEDESSNEEDSDDDDESVMPSGARLLLLVDRLGQLLQPGLPGSDRTSRVKHAVLIPPNLSMLQVPSASRTTWSASPSRVSVRATPCRSAAWPSRSTCRGWRTPA